jgi:FixJ family two-component response regulator
MNTKNETALESSCVCVIDDDPEVRGALGSLFRSVGRNVALFESRNAFLLAGIPKLPSCLVLDIQLQRESGLDVQADFRDAGIAIPIILITGYGDIPKTVQGMKAGAVDFLSKPFSEEDMLAAVATAIEIDQKRRTEEDKLARVRALYDDLTSREQQVMGFVVAGLMNKQIAAKIGISQVTVKIHRGHVMRKMGADSLADLVRTAELLGIRDRSVSRFNT